MPRFEPTLSQKAAIETRGSAVLVSAGAGSGKTKVLTERLMAYVTDPERPEDLDRFLVITFTRAAAGELKGRITEELSAALAADPGNKRLRRQSALCRKAQIGTIHSFCSRLLRENSHLLQLSPDFKIVDEERASAMKTSALERAMELCYEKPEEHPGFLALADTVGAGRSDARLAELVLELHKKMQSHARPALWAQRQIEALYAEGDAGDTAWGREILGWARRLTDYWSGEIDRLLEEMRREERIFAAYGPSLMETGEALRELGRAIDMGWDKARASLPVPFPRLGSLRNSPDEELSEKVKTRRDLCKKSMENLAEALYSDSQTLMADMAMTAPAMRALLDLTLFFDELFAKDKRRRSLVDYADLEHMTARLLTDEEGQPTPLARQVSQRYTEIMVDEYQDVSRVQDAIFRAISREGRNLFLVGDVKQAIYRFRLADPSIFTEKYDSFQDNALAPEGEPRRILLQENFRSRQEILDAANCVFSRCMSRWLGDLDYDENAMLKFGAEYYQGHVPTPELLLLSLEKAQDDAETPDKTAQEAALVADKIRDMMGEGLRVQGSDGPRPLEYGDIAILLRAAGSVGGVYRRVLAAKGIPVSAGQGGGYFSSLEVSTAVSLLSVIDDPHQDIPLIAVLRSPVFGFSADELSYIRVTDKDADYYGALCLAAESGEKCRAFLTRLERLRRLAADLEVEELIWTLLSELDMLAVFSAMADGERRRLNLLELAALAQGFESSGYRGLHRFVLWLRRLAESGKEPTVGGPGGSAVQIVSIHQSKGLEYPVVFLCDLAREFNKQDTRATVLVHPELGLGPKVTDLERRVEYPSLARHAIRQRLDREQLSEEMRLLYVAMTRPRERLVMTAALRQPEKRIEKLAALVGDPLSPELLATASAPVNWLIQAALAEGEEHLRLRLVSAEQREEQSAQAREAAPADEATLRALEQKLSYVYPYAAAENLPSKVTATELKGRSEPDEDAQSLTKAPGGAFRMPDFTRKNKPLTGAQRGTATHLVLQYMDFDQTGSRDAVLREIERLRQRQVLSDKEAEAVNAGAIVKLFASPLGQRMLKAEKRWREFKFSLLCDTEELFDAAPGDQVLLQGVVDCCMEEDGQLTVIDYKTDAVRTEEEIAARSAHYAGQLRAYAAALRRIFQKPVRECVLYYLAAGRAVHLRDGENQND